MTKKKLQDVLIEWRRRIGERCLELVGERIETVEAINRSITNNPISVIDTKVELIQAIDQKRAVEAAKYGMLADLEVALGLRN